jgi:hypothetical protein
VLVKKAAYRRPRALNDRNHRFRRSRQRIEYCSRAAGAGRVKPTRQIASGAPLLSSSGAFNVARYPRSACRVNAAETQVDQCASRTKFRLGS